VGRPFELGATKVIAACLGGGGTGMVLLVLLVVFFVPFVAFELFVLLGALADELEVGFEALNLTLATAEVAKRASKMEVARYFISILIFFIYKY
jgi:hypothetical protein